MSGRNAVISWLTRSVAVLALALLGNKAALATDTGLVKITRIAGTVESLNADETGGEWLEAYPGDQLGPGWSLRTGPDSKALLVFPLNNTVILKENSYLTVNAVDSNGGAKLQTSDGGVLVDIKNHLTGGAEFQVDAGAALAVVRGTKFGVFYRQGGEWSRAQGSRRQLKRKVRFYGYDGTVTLRNSLGEQKLEKGFDVDADEGLRLHRARKSSDESKQFLSRLERAEEFEKFEKDHPNLGDKLREREEKRKTFIERAKQKKHKHGNWRDGNAGGPADDGQDKGNGKHRGKGRHRGADQDSGQDQNAGQQGQNNGNGSGKRHPGPSRRLSSAGKNSGNGGQGGAGKGRHKLRKRH